jgi:hypothetical protein
MHALVNRAIQCFVTDTQGRAVWHNVLREAGLDSAAFETLMRHDPSLTQNLIDAAMVVMQRPKSDLLEDTGTYLVSHPHVEALRRLLRFGGEGYVDFLHSLDDLRDRARLAVSDLDLPELELHDHAADRFSLQCMTGAPYRSDDTLEGFGHVMMGVLRAMADDYGALVVLDLAGGGEGCEVIEISLIEQGYSTGRRFDLGRRAG